MRTRQGKAMGCEASNLQEQVEKDDEESMYDAESSPGDEIHENLTDLEEESLSL